MTGSLVSFWWDRRPDGNIDMEMGSIHREKVERGQTQQGGRGHEVEVGVVGKCQVPDHRQGQAEEGDEKCRHIKGLPVMVNLMMVAMGRPLMVMVVVISNAWSG